MKKWDKNGFLNLWQTKKVEVVAIILLATVVVTGFFQYTNARNFKNLSNQLSENNTSTAEKIKELEDTLLITQDANYNLTQALEEARAETDSVSNKLSKIDNTVDDLEKLSKTDPELLQKYSKVYFLNEHYVPSGLSDIDEEYLSQPERDMQIHAEVKRPLEKMIDKAAEDGVILQIASAYRSFGTQAALKSNYVVTYGAGTANQFSADQGYSEHQLGTTVDFTTPSIGGGLSGFSRTAEYQWLLENAYRYGFVLSYPDGNSYYEFEPWHWRFVGEDLARDLHKKNLNFYDWDQREIDKYLISIWD